jgi:ubiquinone biosynthesis protein COQ4
LLGGSNAARRNQEAAMKPHPLLENHPLRALRALRALEADPDDLPQVFTIIDNLPGRAPGLLLERLRGTPSGRRLLADRPHLAATLSDRAHLATLPAGSLGRAYLAFVEEHGISPAGIVEASEIGGARPRDLDPDMVFVGDRMRDAHDLWHVVTGYGTDLVGEAALLAFSYAQTKNPGVLLVVLLGAARFAGEQREVMWDGYKRGARAAWLPEVEWESLLARPLDEVRRLLEVGPLPVYTPVTSESLRQSGDLAPKTAA